MALRVETFQGLNSLLEESRCSIARSCQAVEQCLEFNRDNLRGFFEQCFSLLLKQVFGYDGSSWLNSIAKGAQEQDAKALVGLLAPNSALMQAMQSADSDDLIKFEFPLNRLPTHSQQLLRLDAGRAQLEKWPQYHKHIMKDGRGGYHVHLNVFEYFVFWTAFYVLRSSQVVGDYHPQASPRGYSHLTPSLGTVRKALGVHRDRPHALRHPYLRLLQLYLEHFLPRSQPGKALPPPQGEILWEPRVSGCSARRKCLRSFTGRCPEAWWWLAGFQSPVRSRASDAARGSRGRMLFSVLVEFWLTDGDEPVPLPPSSPGGQDLAAAWKAANSLRVRSYQPPSEDLIEALVVLVRYVTAAGDKREGGLRPAQTSQWLPALPAESNGQQARPTVAGYAPPTLGLHASAASQGFSRRMYRFLHRALRFWPEQQPLTPIVHLWLSFATPWCCSVLFDADCLPDSSTPPRRLASALKDIVSPADRESLAGGNSGSEVRAWEGHILSNTPFYAALLPLFLDLLCTRVSTRGDAALSDLIKVLQVLKASPKLLELLRAVEADTVRYTSQAGRRPEGPYADVLPFIVDQRQDWESFAAIGQTQALPQSVEDAVGTSMFGTGQNSLAAKARDLLNAAAGAAKEEVVTEARRLAHAVLPIDQLPSALSQAPQQSSQRLKPIKSLRRGTWQQLQYKGDWMRRPLSSSEIGWLVRLLLLASDRLNHSLRLDQPPPEDGALEPAAFLEGVSLKLRKKGWRVNLRPLGEKQTLAWLPVCIFLLWLLLRAMLLVVGAVFAAGEVEM